MSYISSMTYASDLPTSVPVRQLEAIFERCEGAYSDSTLRGYASDLQIFQAWCAIHGHCWLPAEAKTLALFIDGEIGHIAISTLKRRLAAISFAHRLSDLPSPLEASTVLLALRRATRTKLHRPKQAQGLTSDILCQIAKGLPDTIEGKRDAALISVGYDTLCRSSELAAMRVEDLNVSREGSCSVLTTRSKGDQIGHGRIAWLSPKTVERLRRWMAAAELDRGPLFRALNRRYVSDAALDNSSIRRLIKRAAVTSGVELNTAVLLSGHSMRVGAAQDMLVAGLDSLAIMQAGGWKSTNVLLRYVENASIQALHVRRWRAVGSA
jgi:integrase/recombinase XerD